jgi:hypothetical protein
MSKRQERQFAAKIDNLEAKIERLEQLQAIPAKKRAEDEIERAAEILRILADAGALADMPELQVIYNQLANEQEETNDATQ